MSEWKRVFLNKKRLGIALLLLIFSVGLYIYSLADTRNPSPYNLKSSVAASRAASELVNELEGLPIEEVSERVDEYLGRIRDYELWYIYSDDPETYAAVGNSEIVTAEDAEALIRDIPYLYAAKDNRDMFLRGYMAFSKAIGGLKDQTEYLMGYRDYLEGIQAQAKQQSQVGIFSSGSGFSQRNLTKTAKDFEGLADVEVAFGSNAGLESWLGFDFNDYAYLIAIIVIVLTFLEERKKGLWSAIRSCRNGRLPLGLSRLGILAAAAVGFALLIYGSTFVTALGLNGGWSGLNRPLQSLESFRTCAVRTTISGWLIRYFALKAASGMLIGLLLWCLLGSVANIQFSLSVLLGILAGEYILYEFLPVQSVFNVLKYFNLFSYVHTSGLYTDYLNVNLFGFPVGIRRLMLITLPIAGAILLVWALMIQTKRYPEGNKDILSKLSAVINRFFDIFRSRLTIGGWEAYKTLILEFGAVIMAVILVLSRSIYCLYNLIEQDYWYQEYLEELEGPINESTYDYLARARENIRDSMNEFQLESSLDRLEAEVEKRVQAAENGGFEPWLVDEKVYESCYGPTAKNAQYRSAAFALLFVAFCAAGISAYERQSGVTLLIRSLKRGRRRLFCAKAVCAAATAVFVWAAVYIKEFLDFLKFQTPVTFGAPVQNIDALVGFPLKISFGEYLIILYSLRLLMLIFASFAVLLISRHCATLQSAYIVCVVLLAAPALLSVLGVDALKYISPMVPVSSAGQLWAIGSGSFSSVIPWVIWSVIGMIALIAAGIGWSKTGALKNRAGN